MIRYIKGVLEEAGTDYIVVDNQGIGYSISIPASVTGQLPCVGESVKIYTYLYMRGGLLELYGFLTKDDLYVFRLLIKVNGIGPKGALAILSTISADKLRLAVMAGDEKAIAKAPGVGKKTAQKLIIELKDKLKLEDMFEESADQADNPMTSDAVQEAVLALTALGYSDSEAVSAVRRIKVTEGMDSEAVLKLALKEMLTF